MPANGPVHIVGLREALEPRDGSAAAQQRLSLAQLCVASAADLRSHQRPSRWRPSRLWLGTVIALGVAWAAASHALPYHAGISLGRRAKPKGDGAVTSINRWRMAVKALPAEMGRAASTTAAESVLMGIFVMICAFELWDATGPEPAAPQAVRAASSPSFAGAARDSAADTPCEEGESKQAGEAAPQCGRPPLAGKTASALTGPDNNTEKTQLGPLIVMMILLHVIYPSFPTSPEVEIGRIATFIGFVWSAGPMSWIAVVNMQPIHKCKLVLLTFLCTTVHLSIFIVSDTISDLIFPEADARGDLYMGPRYAHELFSYLVLHCPVRGVGFGSWFTWWMINAVLFTSALWKEFLFRGVYLGGLKTQMPFWAANLVTASIYALAHEPVVLTADGTIRLRMVSLMPLVIGAMWYGYIYYKCNSLAVILIAQLLFNASLLGLHFSLGGGKGL